MAKFIQEFVFSDKSLKYHAEFLEELFLYEKAHVQTLNSISWRR